MEKVVVSNKFKLKDLYDEYKKTLAKKLLVVNRKS